MCGRYSFAPKPHQLDEALPDVALPDQLEISFNIAPTQLAYVVPSHQPHTLQKMEWGLVPHWSKDGKNNGKLINARAEGIEEKPSFREAIRSSRCLVPADCFYEWRAASGGKKIPYRIFLENGALLFMAGICDEWQQGDVVKRTFSIITTSPNAEMATLHNRMPVILPTAAIQKQWLSDLPLERTLDLLHPLADNRLSMYRISEKINKPGYSGQDLHDPVPEPWELF